MIIAIIVVFMSVLVAAEITTWNWVPLPKNEVEFSGVISISLKREPRSPSESFKDPPKFSR